MDIKTHMCVKYILMALFTFAGSEFYVKFIRREGDDQERNILDIEGLSPVEAVKISTKNMDHIRYVRISGDNIKVRQLNFSFA